MMAPVNSFKDLKIWQAGMELAVVCYDVTNGFPDRERYGLTSHIRRAASSVPANIAEGHGRETTGAFIQYLRVAQGSLRELETHLLLAIRLNFLAEDRAVKAFNLVGQLGRMIRSLIRRLQDKER